MMTVNRGQTKHILVTTLGVIVMIAWLPTTCFVWASLWAEPVVDREPIAVFAAKPATSPLYPFHVHEVKDGDTLQGDIDLPWKVTLRDESVRMLGYDAWEIRKGDGVDEAHIAKGHKAQRELSQLLADRAVYVSPENNGHYDNFGRPLAFVFVRQGNELVPVHAWMKARGHAKPEP